MATSLGLEVIVDNSDAGFSVLSQTWSLANLSGQYGADYRFKLTSDSPPGEVEWRPTLPLAGTYEVALYYRSTGSGRPSNAAYTVHHANGSTNVTVNQQINGSTWVAIGTYSFVPGTTGRLTLTSQAEAGKTIVADAARWRFVNDPQPGDYDGDGDVDTADFAVFEACWTGASTGSLAPQCRTADIDRDFDVDQCDFAFFQLCLTGPDVPGNPLCAWRANQIPPRPANAALGSAFVAQVWSLPKSTREQLVLSEITSGNLPSFLRNFIPVTVTATIGGVPRTGTFYVMRDVLGVGSDADWCRMPMGPRTAQSIGDSFGCIMPTRKMVNSIYTASTTKVAPRPYSPSSYNIESVDVFYQSHNYIEGQRVSAGAPVGAFMGGIKKDVVITAQLATNPLKVAIYGWHQLNGSPIQPLYLGHEITYMDYSHGIRLVKQVMLVDGQPMLVTDVLAHPTLNALISDEGAVTDPRYD